MARKILIVDDDAEFRSELKGFLDGYEIIEASSGREALSILSRANEIGLVILDIMMPGLTGTEVLCEIKKNDPNLGIIILTGHSSKDLAIEALRGKADDYIEKPLDIDKIQSIIDRIFEKRQAKIKEIDISGIRGKVEKAKYFAEINCYKKTCLDDAAKSVCLSPKYLSRIFKEEAGMGFTEYRLRIKIEKAKGLLVKGGLKVDQVSDKLGYENTESFIRQFKKRLKLTPSEYRKRSRVKIKSKKKRTAKNNHKKLLTKIKSVV